MPESRSGSLSSEASLVGVGNTAAQATSVDANNEPQAGLANLQTVTRTVSSLTGNTLKALEEFRADTGALEFPELDAAVRQLAQVSDRLSTADLTDTANIDQVMADAKEFEKLQQQVSSLRAELSSQEIGGVALSDILETWQENNEALTIQGGRLAKTVSDFQEETGKSISESFESAIGTIASSQIADDLKSSLPIALAGPLGPLVAAFDDLIGLDKLYKAPIALFGALFGGNKDKKKEAKFRDTFFARLGTFLGLGKTVNSPAQGLLPRLRDGLSKAKGAVVGKVRDDDKSKTKVSRSLLGPAVIGGLLLPIIGIVGSILGGLSLGKFVGDFVKGKVDDFVQFLTGDEDATLGTALFDLQESISMKVSEWMESITGFFEDPLGNLESLQETITTSVTEFFTKIQDTISEAVTGFFEDTLGGKSLTEAIVPEGIRKFFDSEEEKTTFRQADTDDVEQVKSSAFGFELGTLQSDIKELLFETKKQGQEKKDTPTSTNIVSPSNKDDYSKINSDLSVQFINS